MSTEPVAPPPEDAKKKQTTLLLAIVLLIVALAALFFFVLRPMLFAPDVDVTAPGVAPDMPGAPAVPGAPPAPGAPPVPGAPADTGAAPPAPGGASVTLIPEVGEIVVWGQVSTVDAASRTFTMTANSIQLGGKSKIPLTPARAKTVVVNANTTITGATPATGFEAIAPGVQVEAVGPNNGEGVPLDARAINVSP